MVKPPSSISIKLINETSRYFPEVVDLGDQQQKIFRFLRRSVYEGYAKNPGIFIALSGQELVGYLMWSTNNRQREVRIWQLCVKHEYQKQGIARLLNNAVIEQTKTNMRRIRLECLADYGLDELWKRLGYACVDNKPAKTENDHLNIWVLEYIHPEYRSIFELNSEDNMFAIDAKTLYSLLHVQSKSQDLLGLLHDLKICITYEICNEISDNNDYDLLNAINFLVKHSDTASFQEYNSKIKQYLDSNNLNLEETYIRHIARCAASGVPYFITSWDSLLRISSEIYVKFGVRPVTFEQSQDIRENLADYLEYPPILLAHSSFEKVTLTVSDISNISNLVYQFNSQQDFDSISKMLRSFTTDEESLCYTLSYNNKPYVCIAESRSEPDQLSIPFLRILDQSILAKSIASYAVNCLLKKAISCNFSQIIVNGLALGEMEKDILKGEYFIKSNLNNDWIKICPHSVMSSQEILQYLQTVALNLQGYSQASKILCAQLSASDFGEYPSRSIDLERILWPLKISDSGLESFIVPIKPEAAKELFDEKLAQETLFGVQNESLFLNLESVYYKSKQAPLGMKQSPYRILWYVSKSKDEGGHTQLQSIRACSQVDQVIFGSPQELYEKFQHLGFYKLEQVQACASSRNAQIMAIKFSHTELFDNPVSLREVIGILTPGASKNISFQSARLISAEHFMQIYKLGFNIS